MSKMNVSLQQMRYKLEKNKKIAYNNSFLIKNVESGSDYESQQWDQMWYKAPIAQIYEQMREFEQAHECDDAHCDIYTGDDAFPDSYNHAAFLNYQRVDTQTLEWEHIKCNHQKTLSLWDQLNKRKPELMEMKP